MGLKRSNQEMIIRWKINWYSNAALQMSLEPGSSAHKVSTNVHTLWIYEQLNEYKFINMSYMYTNE